jgi:hypothetical protein
MKLRRFSRNKGVRLIWLAFAAADTARTPRSSNIKMYMCAITARTPHHRLASSSVTAQRNIRNRTTCLMRQHHTQERLLAKIENLSGFSRVNILM